MIHVRYAALCLLLPSVGEPRSANAGVTQLVSSPGLQFKAGGSASYATISGDGRFVAFVWGPGGLVGADTNGGKDVYVKDLTTGGLEVVSTGPSGLAAGGGLFGISMSEDGRFVAFSSTSKTLVPGDTLTHADVFVHDRAAHVTTRISNGIAGLANGGSDAPALSADGRFVAFLSNAENLIASDIHPSTDIFVHDRQTGVTVMANTDTSGAQVNGPVQINQYPKVSADGRFVAFNSGQLLVTGPNLIGHNAWRKDLQTGAVDLVSVDFTGATGVGGFVTDLTSDGRYVVFSTPGACVAGDSNGAGDIYVRDLQTGGVERVSVATSGAEGNSWSQMGRITADARYVAFSSFASNLMAPDSALEDVFLRDRLAGITSKVSVSSVSGVANGYASFPTISADGQRIAYGSTATNIVAGAVDGNGAADAFVHWQDGFHGLGGGLAGALGVPVLGGTGSLAPGTNVAISVTNAAPSAAGAIVVSPQVSTSPFYGGTLLASPPLVVLMFATDGTGAFTAAALLPAGPPPPASGLAYLQAAMADGGAPHGVALSNLLLASPP